MSHVWVVHKGRVPGIYDSWGEAFEQIHKFRGAVHHRFDARTELAQAQDFLKNGPAKPQGLKEELGKSKLEKTLEWMHVHAPKFSDPETTVPLMVFCDGSVRLVKDTEEALVNKSLAKSTKKLGYWACQFVDKNDERNCHGRFLLGDPTSNRCELMACYQALTRIKEDPQFYRWRMAPLPSQLIMIKTDSDYTIKALAKRADPQFRHKNKTNTDLIDKVFLLSEFMPVVFVYVPGHSGVAGNEAADQATKQAHNEHMSELEQRKAEFEKLTSKQEDYTSMYPSKTTTTDEQCEV